MSHRNVTNDVTSSLAQLWEVFGLPNRKTSANSAVANRQTKFDALKKRALQVFAREGGWLDPPAWASRAGFYPVRAAYSYLLRLHRQGLLSRRRDARARIIYRITPRGRRRWEWLKARVP